jgi:hypothetical protein
MIIVALILQSFRIDEKRCLELIVIDIQKNDGIVSYPSTLGQDCSLKEKLQLILFLVCIMHIIYINSKKETTVIKFQIYRILQATMYMKDQSSSHCIPLAVDLFHPGWDPTPAIAAVK